ncbi:MAG TPA: 16S rRNA (cytosine(967)-C(5))-methyltransferase RsmB [Gemmatimonadales bacterium]|nr:16S rRNA (cytosine(967)-C(5))-methyltransferase RsmB [Gemmatimonadales bacterium]
MPDAPGIGLDARRAALLILREVRGGAPFDAALTAAIPRLPDADRRLAHELAAGILRRQHALDDRLAPLTRLGWETVSEPLRDLLRLGAYQLLQLERVPPHAAVSTTVELAREAVGGGPAGFVNAVLRRLARGGAAPAIAESADPVARLARAHSHPEWLVAGWVGRFGTGGTEALLRHNDTRPPLVLAPARESTGRLAERLRQSGIAARPAPFDSGLVIEGARPADLPGYSEGAFIVQDAAQGLVVRFADIPDGSAVFDACAAPGGKTIGLGRRARLVVAGEHHRRRVRRLNENLARAGSGREFVVVADAATPPVRPMDAVLLDAPCLGTGSFARHPDARWRVTVEALRSLVETQARLLRGVAAAVRPGGLLVYATCSLEPEENEDQVQRFLEEHPAFRRDTPATVPAECLSPAGDLSLMPHVHGTDGAFAARLRRDA